jgi:hypothetical protein
MYKRISVFILLILLLITSRPVYGFQDVEEQDMEMLHILLKRKIIKGKDDGLFHGQDIITRAEAAKVLVKAFNLKRKETESAFSFTDSYNHWGREYIEVLWSHGIIAGVSKERFNPDGNLTYTQWVKMLLEVDGYKEEAMRLGGYPNGYLAIARDQDWYDEDVDEANRQNIAESLAKRLMGPIRIKSVMTVRGNTAIQIDTNLISDELISPNNQLVTAYRWRYYDQEENILMAERIDLDEDAWINDRELSEAIEKNIRLDFLGIGTYSFVLELMDEYDAIIYSYHSKVQVLPRDVAVNDNKPILFMDVIRLSRGYGGDGGHKGTYAIDLIGKDSGSDALYSPFDGVITKIYSENGEQNFVWLESLEPQRLANGEIDYITVMTGHDRYIESLYVGKIIQQGEPYYHEGNSGIALGNHIHLEVAIGKTTNDGWYQNEYGNWGIENGVPPEEVFYLSDYATYINNKESETMKFKYDLSESDDID